MNGRTKFNKYKNIIKLIYSFFNIMPKPLVKSIWNLTRNFSGNLGILIRYCILKSQCENCGENIFVGPNVTINTFENLSLGNNVSIHTNCYIDAVGGICIGNDVSIAHNSSILSSNHTWKNKSIPIKYNESSLKSTIIKDDVWIGCGVRILAGSIINNRVVVAAGAVVNNTINTNILAGGIPAKKIKTLE